MTLCFLPILIAVLLSGIGAFFVTDGGVRRAAHLLLARRPGGVFRPRLVVIGDSLAAGRLWSKLQSRPFAVLNLAEGGATLQQIAGQAYRARDFQDARLLVNGGLNDLLFDEANPQKFVDDCRALFRRLGSHERIIFTLMPFTADPGNAEKITAMNGIIAGLCERHGVGVLDLNEDISLNGVRKSEMTDDGLHFTRAAELLWIERIREMLGVAPPR